MTAPSALPSEPYRILVLGGYGHFGGRICRALYDQPGVQLVVAGRSLAAARRFIETLPNAGAGPVRSARLDMGAAEFAAELASLQPDLVVHTCGPFQGQNYAVAQACVQAGAHYIDLADARGFVAGIGELDAAARERGLLIVSGASTLPALSSAVLDVLSVRFGPPTAADISIAPGQRTPRGLATLRAVLSYCGRPFKALQRGVWQTVYGWQGLRRRVYPGLGARWQAWCDVPDLELLPRRYPTLQSVRFAAALELAPLQWGFWLMAWCARFGLVRDWSRWAHLLQPVGDWFNAIGSDRGGMEVEVEVEAAGNLIRTVRWNLVAGQGHGPEIPCIPAIVLARKLAAGSLTARGAMPCMGLFTLADFVAASAHLDIHCTVLDG